MQAVTYPREFAASRQQRGVVLVVALIFLLLITVLAISASGTSLLQEKLVGGLRNSQLAEWSAESALRGAEWRLWRASSDPGTRMQCGTSTLADCYNYDAVSPLQMVTDFRTAPGWVTAGGTEYKPVDYTADSTDKSFGLFSTNRHIYRITARGVGNNENSIRVLETTFAAKSD
jgi:type IV pilus assembly protein PilX